MTKVSEVTGDFFERLAHRTVSAGGVFTAETGFIHPV